MSDLIDRQAAMDAICKDWCNERRCDCIYPFDKIKDDYYHCDGCDDVEIIKNMPSAQPEIIQCKDCRWWDKYGDYDNGYCMAAKHGYLSEHWEIFIRRTYKGNFYCADAEPKGERND